MLETGMKRTRITDGPRTILLFACVMALFTGGFFVAWLLGNKEHRDFSLTLSSFSSDFSGREEHSLLYTDQVYKKDRFSAYGVYARIPSGHYRGIFYLGSESSAPVTTELQIASERGKEVLFQEKHEIDNFPAQKSFVFKVRTEKEIEPRLLFLTGSEDLYLEKAVLERTQGLIPWANIFLNALWGSVLATLLILSVWSAFKPDGRWKLFLALFFFLAGFFLILRQAWISEDAFITLRHVDNFLAGSGPVFNPGERVEGFSHPLWFAILSLFRWTGLTAKGSAVLPGLIFSFFALFVLFFKIRFPGTSRGEAGLNPAAAVLIGVSAFIDFGTSGLETALSYFLLVLLAKFLAEETWKSKPLLMGLVISLLILTRPDFFVFLVFMIPFCVFEFVKKRWTWRAFVSFLTFPVVLAGLYEIFRMGYYASLFPNPFYAKSGSASYFAQGWAYLFDFSRGSLAPVAVLLALFALWMSRKDGGLKSRSMVFSAGLFYLFFIVRGGGDFMHGRFLLPSLLLVAASAGGAFDRFFDRSAVFRNAAVLSFLALFLLSLAVQPVQKKGVEINSGISNERHYFYKDKIIPFRYLFRDTMIIMWKTMGQNYRWLSEEARMNIRLAQTNVGFLGYYSGQHIYLIDRLGLTDPVVSRIGLEKRTRPGHEKHAPFGYLVLQKLTFGETPFPIWNEAAYTRFGILWDLSPTTLKKLRPLIGEEVKDSIDRKVLAYLSGIEGKDLEKEAEFLFFLKEFWYPFAPAQDRARCEKLFKKTAVSELSDSCIWIEANRAKVEKLLSRIRGPLNVRRFVENIAFSLGQGRRMKF